MSGACKHDPFEGCKSCNMAVVPRELCASGAEFVAVNEHHLKRLSDLLDSEDSVVKSLTRMAGLAPASSGREFDDAFATLVESAHRQADYVRQITDVLRDVVRDNPRVGISPVAESWLTKVVVTKEEGDIKSLVIPSRNAYRNYVTAWRNTDFGSAIWHKTNMPSARPLRSGTWSPTYHRCIYCENRLGLPVEGHDDYTCPIQEMLSVTSYRHPSLGKLKVDKALVLQQVRDLILEEE